jgi:hypothetical protein
VSITSDIQNPLQLSDAMKLSRFCNIIKGRCYLENDDDLGGSLKCFDNLTQLVFNLDKMGEVASVPLKQLKESCGGVVSTRERTP